MAVHNDYIHFIQDQLSDIPDMSAKKMFGGMGFFREGIMFAMIAGDKFRFRADDESKVAFEVYGMKNFQPNPARKGMPYWEVPIEILEDKAKLTEWAEIAFDVALRHKKS